MSPEEVRAALQDPVAQRLLFSPNPARLAYVARDGTPRVVPVGYHWDGQAFVLGTAIAGATVFGVVSSQTDAPDESPANVNQPAAAIDYGSNS